MSTPTKAAPTASVYRSNTYAPSMRSAATRTMTTCVAPCLLAQSLNVTALHHACSSRAHSSLVSQALSLRARMGLGL
jgi:hypothetical protein